MVYPDGDNHPEGDGIEDFLEMIGFKSIMTGFHEIFLGPKISPEKEAIIQWRGPGVLWAIETVFSRWMFH